MSESRAYPPLGCVHGPRGAAIREFVDDFGPDFDEHGDPLEAGESDRIHSEEERAKPGRTAEAEAEAEKETATA